jgi:hypothetical protein
MSPADRDDARLPARVEALLSEWPLPEKDEQEWEARAQAIQARLLDAQHKSSADLLRPPFPSSSGEDGADQQRASSPKLTDIARAVRESKPDHLGDAARARRDSKPDQNLTEIAKASLSIASQARAAAPELAARVRAAQAAQAPAVATPVPEGPSAPAEPPRSEQRVEPAPGNRRGPLYAVIGGGLALAAALAVVVRTKNDAPTESLQAQAPAATAPAASAAPSEPPPPVVEPDGVDVEDLQPGELAPDSKIAQMPRHRPARPASKPEAKAARPKGPEPQSAPAEGIAAEPPLKPADGRTGLPEKPSTGAVQAALGSVIGGARSCVSGQDRPSNATIVFGSDGRVQSVTVGGAAAGTPAAGCIRSALEKARVNPFAKPTFSASVTIRPN